MADPRGNHATYRTRLKTHIIEFKTILDEFNIWEGVLKKQQVFYENDWKSLCKYRDLLNKKLDNIQDDYTNSLATLQKAIQEKLITKTNEQGVVVPDTFENQEKFLQRSFDEIRYTKLDASERIANHLVKWEDQKAKLIEDAKKADQTRAQMNAWVDGPQMGAQANANVIKAKPETLKPDKLTMSATPLQYKHWKTDFLAFFRAINGTAGDIEQQQSFLRACIADEFREDLNFENLPVTNPDEDDTPYDNPAECHSCLQRLNKYFLQRVPMIIRRFHAMKGTVNVNRPILEQFDRFHAEYRDTDMAAMTAEENLILSFLSRIPKNSDLFHEIIKEIHITSSKRKRIDISYSEFYKFIQAYDALHSVTSSHRDAFAVTKTFKKNKQKAMNNRGRSKGRSFSRNKIGRAHV